MVSLKFSGDITLEEIFVNHRTVIYDKVVEAIQSNYSNLSVSKIRVLNILLNDFEYSIDLSRDKFISGLTSAISAYEHAEEYEKCQTCLDLIKKINTLK